MKPTIDWDAMTPREKREVMEEGREACEREMHVLMEALNGRPKGPGRPKNGSTKLTAADLEPAD